MPEGHAQSDLPFSAVPTLSDLLAADSCCAKVARLLLSRRGEWISARDLAQVGGIGGWRTRVSNLRKAPWYLDVEAKVWNEGKRKYSAYRVLPAQAQGRTT